ncbi:hypothetical protein BDQ12DRAFT_116581 [Crucibulum laeve]|uniref:Extracellular membrane protein CFEM domain-containing protein n=1 Tax=Crucibulum laeve TaxID=68775 RepID=A0A5C3M0N7_9AGAR|nr:hypothetical protein BDQ12DRAFT_116581 [Crucibulum laeve]
MGLVLILVLCTLYTWQFATAAVVFKDNHPQPYSRQEASSEIHLFECKVVCNRLDTTTANCTEIDCLLVIANEQRLETCMACLNTASSTDKASADMQATSGRFRKTCRGLAVRTTPATMTTTSPSPSRTISFASTTTTYIVVSTTAPPTTTITIVRTQVVLSSSITEQLPSEYSMLPSSGSSNASMSIRISDTRVRNILWVLLLTTFMTFV